MTKLCNRNRHQNVGPLSKQTYPDSVHVPLLSLGYINQNSRGWQLQQWGRTWYRVPLRLWPVSFCKSLRHSARRSHNLSVSNCLFVRYVELRASKPQNFQRFSKVAPTPLNSCLNMLGSRTINRSRSLAEIWEKRFRNSIMKNTLYYTCEIFFFSHKLVYNAIC